MPPAFCLWDDLAVWWPGRLFGSLDVPLSCFGRDLRGMEADVRSDRRLPNAAEPFKTGPQMPKMIHQVCSVSELFQLA